MRLAANVYYLWLGIQVDGLWVVDVSVYNNLNCSRADVFQWNFTNFNIRRWAFKKESVIVCTKSNSDHIIEETLVPVAINPELTGRRTKLDPMIHSVQDKVEILWAVDGQFDVHLIVDNNGSNKVQTNNFERDITNI